VSDLAYLLTCVRESEKELENGRQRSQVGDLVDFVMSPKICRCLFGVGQATQKPIPNPKSQAQI